MEQSQSSTHYFYHLTSNDVFHKLDGFVVWILHLSEDEHLEIASKCIYSVMEDNQTDHLGNFLGVPILLSFLFLLGLGFTHVEYREPSGTG